MAEYPPYMMASGTVPKVLQKIKDAKTPDRFTQDYLATKLGFPGGSAKAFIPLAKRLGLLNSDGSPSEIYKSFRNPKQSEAAMAAAVRKGYSDLYERNEYVHEMTRSELEGLVMEATGLEKGSSVLKAIVGTFEALKTFADFEKEMGKESSHADASEPISASEVSADGDEASLNLSYTIYLNLPKTDDVAVFNAIFKSLKDNLLKK